MKVTPILINLVCEGLIAKDISRKDLSLMLKKDASWASRFLSGGIKTLNDDLADDLQMILEVDFFSLNPTHNAPSTGSFTIEVEMDVFNRYNQAALARGKVMADWAKEVLNKETKEKNKPPPNLPSTEDLHRMHAEESEPGRKGMSCA